MRRRRLAACYPCSPTATLLHIAVDRAPPRNGPQPRPGRSLDSWESGAPSATGAISIHVERPNPACIPIQPSNKPHARCSVLSPVADKVSQQVHHDAREVDVRDHRNVKGPEEPELGQAARGFAVHPCSLAQVLHAGVQGQRGCNYVWRAACALCRCQSQRQCKQQQSTKTLCTRRLRKPDTLASCCHGAMLPNRSLKTIATQGNFKRLRLLPPSHEQRAGSNSCLQRDVTVCICFLP